MNEEPVVEVYSSQKRVKYRGFNVVVKRVPFTNDHYWEARAHYGEKAITGGPYPTIESALAGAYQCVDDWIEAKEVSE